VTGRTMGLDTSEPSAPSQMSPLPNTVHEAAFSALQETIAEVPERTRLGTAAIEPVAAGATQLAEPGEQKFGDEHVDTVDSAQDASVYVIVWLPGPVHE